MKLNVSISMVELSKMRFCFGTYLYWCLVQLLQMSLASARERVLEAHVISIEKRYVIFYLSM